MSSTDLTCGQLVIWHGETVRIVRVGQAQRADVWIARPNGMVRRVNASALEVIE